MSGDAILATTLALKARLEAVAVVGSGNVHVGLPGDVGDKPVSLFLYNVVPNRDLRNVERFRQPAGGVPPDPALRPLNALPLDLRFLISVYGARTTGSTVPDPMELGVLGDIMLALHVDPTLSGSLLTGQAVRLTPEPCLADELNRIWGMFPQDTYRTSVVYLASPVFLEDDLALGPPVQSRTLKQGVIEAGNHAELVA